MSEQTNKRTCELIYLFIYISFRCIVYCLDICIVYEMASLPPLHVPLVILIINYLTLS